MSEKKTTLVAVAVSFSKKKRTTPNFPPLLLLLFIVVSHTHCAFCRMLGSNLDIESEVTGSIVNQNIPFEHSTAL